MSYLNDQHHVIQVWSLALVAKESKLVVGSSDRELRVWELELTGTEQQMSVAQERVNIDVVTNGITEDGERNVSIFDVVYVYTK